MKELTQTNLTMSSVELAELTGKRHDNVIRDITKLLKGLGVGHLKFEGTYLTRQNKTSPCFNLPKRECDLLMMGYSITLRAKVYDRWAELEAGAVQPMLKKDVPLQAIPSKDPLTVLLHSMAQTRLDAEQQAEKLELTAAVVTELEATVQRHGCPEGFITLSKFKDDGEPLSASVLKALVKHYKVPTKRYSHISHGYTQYVSAYNIFDLNHAVRDWHTESKLVGKMMVHQPTGVRYRRTPL